MRKFWLAGAAVAGLVSVGATAQAAAVTVNSTDSVYNYGGTTVAGTGSTAPSEVSVTGDDGETLTFSATGLVSLTPGGEPFGPHGPDGGSQAFSMDVTAAAGLSGVISNNVGYLAGVFINGSEGSTTSLSDSNFTGTGESFASLSPAVDQVFFIGDGLTGTGAGSVQNFIVPIGATELVLGIVDANGYNGPPGAYFDNSGSYAVTVNFPVATSGTPEPAAWALMILGFGAVGAGLRRRRTIAAA
jgi:hypothetical protein